MAVTQLEQTLVHATLLDNPFLYSLNNLKSIPKKRFFAGFEDETFKWFIYGFSQVPGSDFPGWRDILEQYFEEPLKNFGEHVELGSTVPEFYAEFLNRMHGFLFGAIAIRYGVLTLEQVVKMGHFQSGGSLLPPINLFDNQAFYGKTDEDKSKVEIVRICPYQKRGWLGGISELATIEYMICYRKTE